MKAVVVTERGKKCDFWTLELSVVALQRYLFTASMDRRDDTTTVSANMQHVRKTVWKKF